MTDQKLCSKCGESFGCGVHDNCWCGEYEISPEILERLKELYEDCLCPKCLKTVALEKSLSWQKP